jgi:hypothetical protein
LFVCDSAVGTTGGVASATSGLGKDEAAACTPARYEKRSIEGRMAGDMQQWRA